MSLMVCLFGTLEILELPCDGAEANLRSLGVGRVLVEAQEVFEGALSQSELSVEICAPFFFRARTRFVRPLTCLIADLRILVKRCRGATRGATFRRNANWSEQPFHTSCAPLAFTSSSVRLQKLRNVLPCGAASTVLFSRLFLRTPKIVVRRDDAHASSLSAAATSTSCFSARPC